LLDEFKTKLPSVEAVAGRLETQKRFNADRAKLAAATLEKSLQFAGVLDNSNNILPVRETPGHSNPPANQDGADQSENAGRGGDDDTGGDNNDARISVLSLEIPVGEDRKVVVRYPHDLAVAEAKKVGNVLNAVVA
jgi:hypothetical protein